MFGSTFLNWNTLNPNRCNTESLLTFVSKLQKKTHLFKFAYSLLSILLLLYFCCVYSLYFSLLQSP